MLSTACTYYVRVLHATSSYRIYIYIYIYITVFPTAACEMMPRFFFCLICKKNEEDEEEGTGILYGTIHPGGFAEEEEVLSHVGQIHQIYQIPCFMI